MKSARYLDQLAEHKHLKNDAEIARFLGCTKGAISNYRHGTRVMENELCLRIALELGLDNPLPLIMAADADRAERIGQRSLWEVFSPKIAGISAAVIFAIVTNFVTPSPAQAATSLGSKVNAVYLMSNIVSKLRQSLRRLLPHTCSPHAQLQSRHPAPGCAQRTAADLRTVNGRFYESRTQPSPCCG